MNEKIKEDNTFYYLFHPKDFKSISHVIQSAKRLCNESCNCDFNEWEIEIKRAIDYGLPEKYVLTSKVLNK